MPVAHSSDLARWHLEHLTSQIVAKSGNPYDRFHLGKLYVHCFKEDPDFIHQINGATGESETAGSILERSIKCAISLQKLGLQKGDVMALMAPNHLDLAVPFYAAVYLGVIVSSVDRTLNIDELKQVFEVTKPKIIFCQNDKVPQLRAAIEGLIMKTLIVTFDGGCHVLHFRSFLEVDDAAVEGFKPTEYNGEDTLGFLIPTSGTTGVSKFAAVPYKVFTITGPNLWSRCTQFPKPFSSALVIAPLQWLTALVHYVCSPFLKFTRIQSSRPTTPEHTHQIINNYRPASTAISPTLMVECLKPGIEPCDFSCLELLFVGGSYVHNELILDIMKVCPRACVINAYGMTELTGLAFQGPSPIGSCGRPVGLYQYRLVNPETQEDITEPNVPGELWMKGQGMFTEYYNDPVATKEAFAEDGWLRTGDLFYKDEHWNFFFVERIKMMLKYKSYQVSPLEVETVIRGHPGVSDVAVTSVPDNCGDLLVACVVPRRGCQPSAQEIKDLVKDSLADSKQLRGGVIFMNALPTTASTKIHRRKLRDMVLTLPLA